MLHLTGPSSGPTGTSGVKIQGVSVAANGTFKPGTATVIKCAWGGCPLTLNPYTAVLVTIPHTPISSRFFADLKQHHWT